jgi:hypothetical protein
MSAAPSSPRLVGTLLLVSRWAAGVVATVALAALGAIVFAGFGRATGGRPSVMEPAALAALAAGVLAAHDTGALSGRVRPYLATAAAMLVAVAVLAGDGIAATDLMLVLLSAAVGGLGSTRTTTAITHPGVLATLALALAGLLGGWWTTDSSVLTISPAVALGCTFIAAAAALARPRSGVMAALTASGRAGRHVRLLMAGALSAPVMTTAAAGWATHLFGDAAVLPLLVASNVALLGALAGVTALHLADAHAHRDSAEDALRAVVEASDEALPLTDALAVDLTPSAVDVAGWEVGWRHAPAVGKLSGDWFDVAEVNGVPFLILVDVTGHGAGSALIASWCKHQLIAALDAGAAPGEALSSVEPLFSRAGQIATAVVAKLGPVVEFASAGHPPVMAVTAAGVADLGATAPPLGVGTAVFPMLRQPLAPGESLVAVSDGILEARNSLKVEWGDAALRRIVVARRAQGAEPVAEAVFDAAHTHAGARFRDDATVVVVTRTR